MSNNKIMPWIDSLAGVTETDICGRRDAITRLMSHASELARKAEELRAEAYLASCSLEGAIKGHWTNEQVEQAKRRVGW